MPEYCNLKKLRKKYGGSLDFMRWVLEQELPPYTVKMHIQATTHKEISMEQLHVSIESLVEQCSISLEHVRLVAKFFPRRKRWKVYVQFESSEYAKWFFSKAFLMKTIES